MSPDHHAIFRPIFFNQKYNHKIYSISIDKSLYTSVMEWAKPSPDVELMNLASIEDINFNSGSDSLLRCQVTTPAVTRY